MCYQGPVCWRLCGSSHCLFPILLSCAIIIIFLYKENETWRNEMTCSKAYRKGRCRNQVQAMSIQKLHLHWLHPSSWNLGISVESLLLYPTWVKASSPCYHFPSPSFSFFFFAPVSFFKLSPLYFPSGANTLPSSSPLNSPLSPQTWQSAGFCHPKPPLYSLILKTSL